MAQKKGPEMKNLGCFPLKGFLIFIRDECIPGYFYFIIYPNNFNAMRQARKLPLGGAVVAKRDNKL